MSIISFNAHTTSKLDAIAFILSFKIRKLPPRKFIWPKWHNLKIEKAGLTLKFSSRAAY